MQSFREFYLLIKCGCLVVRNEGIVCRTMMLQQAAKRENKKNSQTMAGAEAVAKTAFSRIEQ